MIVSYNPSKPVNEIMDILNKYQIPIVGIEEVFIHVKERSMVRAIVPMSGKNLDLAREGLVNGTK